MCERIPVWAHKTKAPGGRIQMMLEGEKMKTQDNMFQAKMICEDVVNMMYPEDLDPYNLIPAHITLKRVMEAFDIEMELPDFTEADQMAAATAASLITGEAEQNEETKHGGPSGLPPTGT